MATKIPNQNNLNDVINASVSLIKDIRETIAGQKKRRQKEKPIDLKKELQHTKTDLQAVVEFVKEMHNISKDIDKIVDGLLIVLGMPSNINRRISKIKIEIIDSKKIQLAVCELKRVLNTPAEINEILGGGGEQLRMKSVRNAIDQIVFVCHMPKYINKYLKSIKVDKLDKKTITNIKKSLDLMFGKNSLLDSIEKMAKRLDNFKGLGIRKTIILWNSIFYLNVISGRIVRFGRYSNRHAAELKLAITGSILILKFISEFAKTLQAINDIDLVDYIILPIKIKLISRIVRRMTGLVSNLVDLVWYLPEIALAILALMALNKAVEKLTAVVQSINQFNLNELVMMSLKVRVLARVARIISRRLIPAVESFGWNIVSILIALIGLVVLNKVVEQYNKVINTIASVKITTLIVNLLKIKLLSINAKLIRNLIVHVGALGRSAIRSAMAIPGLVVALVIVSLYSNIVETIRATKMGLFFRVKVRRLILGARLIRVLVRTISNLIGIKAAAKAFISVKLVNAIIKSFASIILNILLLTPIMALFIIVSPIIVVVFWLFAKIFRILVRILAKLVSPKVVLVVVAVTSIIMLLCILGLSLLVLALISVTIVENSLNIILFFGVVVAVSLLLGLLGLILSKLSPVLMSAIYGIGIVALAVFAVLAIAAMLWLLSKIKLDQDKIKENVKKVMETVAYIITCLFEDELNDPESKDNVFVRILKVIGGAVAKIIMALATCIVLVATFVSVACILMIAEMLRILQNIKLDQNKILKNVDTIFDTVERIIARFMSDDKGGKKSNRGLLITVMSWACPPMAKIAEALLSLAYLFLMFLAVTLVLGIASLLRLIQNLDLQITKIQENVDMVFDTVDQIINRIFGDRKDEEHKSNRGILIKIISWVDEGLAKIVEAALSIIYLALAMQAVAMVLAIASLLRLLQNLDLNVDKIKENTNIVFDTADLIINRVFGDRKDEEHKSNRGILVTIISWVDEGLAKIVEAALTIVYLMLVLVAVSVVLGIAGLLSCIQDIDLQFEVIQEKVNTVFDTVDLIINRVFAPTDDSIIPGHGILGKIIGLFNPGLAKIIDALMAIAYVGLAFVAISIVKGMAEALHEIQEINLDEKTVSTKVDTIFKICANIMKQIYEKSDTLLPKPKNRGIFSSLISFFSPGLADIIDALTMIAKLSVVQLAISAVAGIARSLNDINKIDTDLSGARDKVDKVMGIAENVCERIFGRESKIKFPVPPKERQSVFGALISWAFGGKSDEDRALEAAMKKVEALGVIEAAVGALGNILEGAKRIMDMKVEDLSAATTKVTEVMEMAEKLSEAIFGTQVKLTLPEPTADETKRALLDLGIWHWLRGCTEGEIEDAKARASMKLAMQRVETLGLIASAVGSIASIIEGINKINNYEVPDISTIGKKVREVMSAASKVSFIIFNQDGIGQYGGNAAGIKTQIEDIQARIDFAKAGAAGVGTLCESFTSLIGKAKFSENIITNTKVRVSSTISAISEIITQMDEIRPEANGDRVKANCELMDRISKTVGSFVQVDSQDVKNSKAITENYIKFFKQVDSMDIKKLQHTDWLMRSWASISRDLKGDFEGLAKTVNQHIMPMLEKVNETLEKTTKAQQEIIDVMSRPVDINGAGSAGGSFDSAGSTPSEGGTVDTSAPSGPTPGKDDTSGGAPTVKPTKKNLPNPGRPGGMNEEIKSGGTYEITVASVKKIK